MFIEKAEQQRLKDVKPKLYHGHAVIELHNHRTGSRERIEHDNDFTKGIEYYLQSSGWFDNSPFRNDVWRNKSLWSNLVGGVFLFDKAIEKVNGEYPTIMPAGTKMIANGSYGVANNSGVTEMGTWNTQESSVTNDAITMVYDWETSQGNGEIACVSLTSDIGGYVGYGNSVSNTNHPTRKKFFENQVSNAFQTDSAVTFFVKGDSVYYAKTTSESSTNLIYYERKLGIVNDMSLFNGAIQHSVPIPTSVANGSGYLFVMQADVGFAVVNLKSSSNWSDGDGMRPLAVYNITTGTWTTHTAKAYYDCKPESQYAGSVIDNRVLVSGVGGSVGGNGSVLTILDTGVNAGGSNVSSTFFKIAENLYIVRLNDNNSFTVDDLVNNTSYKINANDFGRYQLGIDKNRIMVMSGGNSLKIYRNPLYLATVCNLDEPVTKTSDRTMKLIYTITRKE